MEDSHYCLKCGSTLSGLDNYINHRKAQCEGLGGSKLYEEAMACDNLSKMDVDFVGKDAGGDKNSVFYGEDKISDRVSGDVQADDFFSSLELQSSSKTSSSGVGVNMSGKLSGGIVTRSKSLLSYQDAPKISETIKTKIRFPAKKGKKKKLMKSRKRRKCGEAQKKVPRERRESGSQQKKPNAVKAEEDTSVRSPGVCTDEEWNFFNQLGIKKDLEETKKATEAVPLRRYTPELFSMSPILELSEDKDVVNKFLEDEDYDDDDQYLDIDDVDELNYGPPRCHTGGKWKPGSITVGTSPMLWPSQTWDCLLEEAESPIEGDRYKNPKWKSYNPPSSYTGGKWTPSETPQTVKKPEDPPVTHTGGKWHPGKRISPEPPASHTGGKWKPPMTPSHHGGSPALVPPSDHTRGKWSATGKQAVNKTLNVIASCQSTSGKCLKTSGGLIQYYCSPCNRRLASKKMYKKHVLSELHLKRVLQENELDFDSRSIKILFSVNKQRGAGKREVRKPELFKDMEMGAARRSSKEAKEKKRVARRDLIRCDVCKAKLASHQLGKHLVSYYHSRRFRPDDPNQQKLVLENIHAIVKQAPYQCGICKFYCNTHTLFKKHWASEDHRKAEETGRRRFWCVLCNFECESSRSMELHLDSNSHREVIMSVNKSIPIIIRQRQTLNCNVCRKEFFYNFALIRHNRIAHGVESQNLKIHPCAHCNYKSKTVKGLQRHVIRRHEGNDVPYFCSVCDLHFSSAADAKNHRKSQSHRSRGPSLSRQCLYCPRTLEDVQRLKDHIAEVHPSLRPKCSKCGRVFSLPQEATRHNREKTCEFGANSAADLHRCRLCPFSSAHRSDVLHHEILHDASSDSLKLTCPICGKIYRTLALKIHLRTHTGERPYECPSCSKTFIRRTRLTAHLKLDHRLKPVEEADVPEEKKTAEGPKCGDSKCKYSPKDAEDLDHHTRVHIARKLYQCPLCSYQAKTNTLLKRHNKIHLDERAFPCPHCPFRGRLASHLKRHLRLHTGAKPYKCPHCPYQCNILENLRKHVLYTKIHPGKKLYECKMCEFATNASKAFKQHLLDSHADKFGTEVAITAYMAGIYNLEEDVQTTVNPVPVKQKTTPTAKIDQSNVLKTIAILTKKFEPIAPKPKQILGNSVQDKRKVLEMELEKLKNQAKKKPETPLRSYPTPAILKAEREAKARVAEASKDEDASQQSEANPEEPPPTLILYESGISFVDNEDHLAEQEFYLLENYND